MHQCGCIGLETRVVNSCVLAWCSTRESRRWVWITVNSARTVDVYWLTPSPTLASCTSLSHYGAVLPRRRPHHVLILSVCLFRASTYRQNEKAYELGRKGPWDMSTPWTNFKVKGSKVKVTGHSSCVNVSLIIRISRRWLVDSRI